MRRVAGKPDETRSAQFVGRDDGLDRATVDRHVGCLPRVVQRPAGRATGFGLLARLSHSRCCSSIVRMPLVTVKTSPRRAASASKRARSSGEASRSPRRCGYCPDEPVASAVPPAPVGAAGARGAPAASATPPVAVGAAGATGTPAASAMPARLGAAGVTGAAAVSAVPPARFGAARAAGASAARRAASNNAGCCVCTGGTGGGGGGAKPRSSARSCMKTDSRLTNLVLGRRRGGLSECADLAPHQATVRRAVGRPTDRAVGPRPR